VSAPPKSNYDGDQTKPTNGASNEKRGEKREGPSVLRAKLTPIEKNRQKSRTAEIAYQHIAARKSREEKKGGAERGD